jgi:hypothetical protein
LAEKPPMGWNSYDCCGYSVREDDVKANADYMAAYLRTNGWEYIVVDYLIKGILKVVTGHWDWNDRRMNLHAGFKRLEHYITVAQKGTDFNYAYACFWYEKP